MGFFTNDPFVVATGGPTFLPTGGHRWSTGGHHKMGYGHLVATGGAAMGNAVATGGLPWVVSTGANQLTARSYIDTN